MNRPPPTPLPRITRTTLVACLVAALLALGWLAIPRYSGFGKAPLTRDDLPFLVIVVAPYVGVGWLAWLQRGRGAFARTLLVCVIGMAFLGMVVAGGDVILDNEVIILSFLYPLLTWLIVGGLGLAFLWRRRRQPPNASGEA